MTDKTVLSDEEIAEQAVKAVYGYGRKTCEHLGGEGCWDEHKAIAMKTLSMRQQTRGEEWYKAIDQHLVINWISPKEDETPYETIARLLVRVQEFAIDPSVNGGFLLVPEKPTEKMIDAALWATKPEDMYKAMLKAATEDK